MFTISIKIQGIAQEFTLNGKDFKCITTEDENEANKYFNREKNTLLEYCNIDYKGQVTLCKTEYSSGIIQTSYFDYIKFSLTPELIQILEQSKIIND